MIPTQQEKKETPKAVIADRLYLELVECLMPDNCPFGHTSSRDTHAIFHTGHEEYTVGMTQADFKEFAATVALRMIDILSIPKPS